MSRNMLPAAGYGAASRALGSPRELEYSVIARVTGELSDAIRPGRPFPRLAEALHRNSSLWTALLVDLSHPENALPPDLRASLVSIGGFVRRHSGAVLRREAEADVLVEINTAILRGLRGQPPDTVPNQGEG